MLKITVLFQVILFAQISFGQQKEKKIEIERAESFFLDFDKFPGAQVLSDSVQVSHEGAYMNCERLYLYREDNYFDAHNKVYLNQGDTITLTSDYLKYDGKTKLAKAWGNVVLRDSKVVITTDTLSFDRNIQEVYFDDGGTIKDSINVLKSIIGRYKLREEKFIATKNVKITNPDGVLETEKLEYLTEKGFVFLQDKSTITNDSTRVYTERGFYDTFNDISHLTKNSVIYYKDRSLAGDSLFYNKKIGFVSATKNIRIKDTINDVLIKGQYAELFEKKDSLFVTEDPIAIYQMDEDSLYVHGDTLMLSGPENNRIMRIFNKAKFFRDKLSGKCDSIVSFENKGIMDLLNDPILWYEKRQITGDTIRVIMDKVTEKLDTIKVIQNAFMIDKDTLMEEAFNQVKGRDFIGRMKNDEMEYLDVIGNGQIVYYARDDETKDLVGVNSTVCSNMKFYFQNSTMDKAYFYTKPKSITYPIEELPGDIKFLRGFIWRLDERLLQKDDVFK